MANELARVDPQQEQVAITPMQMIQIAVQQGADIDKLGKLMDLQLRWEQNEARKAFVASMTLFKENPPKITKNAEVDFTGNKGRTNYWHASLDRVSGLIGEALSKVGISHRWEVAQLDGGAIKVTCILTHRQGHSESVFLQASRDDSGNKNHIQAVGSTVTYLQRYTLLAASGMAVENQDDDGRGKSGGGIDDGVKADFLAAIEALTHNDETASDLLRKIAKATGDAGDVPAYQELDAAIKKKVRGLPK